MRLIVVQMNLYQVLPDYINRKQAVAGTGSLISADFEKRDQIVEAFKVRF